MHFDVIHGDIATQTAHALVNTTGCDSAMECGVAGALRERANGPIADDIADEQPIDPGDVLVTDAYDLHALYVLHAVPFSADGSVIEDEIRAAIRSALAQADELGCRSIVVPLLGCGGGGYDDEAGVTCICEAIWEFEPDSLADVRVIGHSEDAFERLRTTAREVKSVAP